MNKNEILVPLTEDTGLYEDSETVTDDMLKEFECGKGEDE